MAKPRPRTSSTAQAAGSPGNASAGTACAVTLDTRPVPRTCPTWSVVRRIGCHPTRLITRTSTASDDEDREDPERDRAAGEVAGVAPVVPPHQRRRSRLPSPSGGAGAMTLGVTSHVPQRRQNRRVGSLAVPQFAQIRCSGAVLYGDAATGANTAPGCGGGAAPAPAVGRRRRGRRGRGRYCGAVTVRGLGGRRLGPDLLLRCRRGRGGRGRGGGARDRPPGCRSSPGNRRSSRRTAAPQGCWCRSSRTPPRPSNPLGLLRAGGLPTLRRRLPAPPSGKVAHRRRRPGSVRMVT